ncbi:MAG: FeoA family protein [Calditrichia bacterium]
MKTLLEVPAQKTVKIVSIVGGKGARQILAQMGIGVGSRITVSRNAPFSGPLLIKAHGTTIALGRGIAKKLLVEEE